MLFFTIGLVTYLLLQLSPKAITNFITSTAVTITTTSTTAIIVAITVFVSVEITIVDEMPLISP